MNYSKLIALSIVATTTLVNGDLRFESKEQKNDFEILQDNVPSNYLADGTPVTYGDDVGVLRYMVPSTFGIRDLDKQKKDKNDQFLRSNIDNEANQRNTQSEAAMDMLPCRQPDMENQDSMAYARGETVFVPFRWNNPHNAECEMNLWTGDMANVAPIRSPFPCGAGYQDALVNFTIPLDVPGCETAADGCFMQIYGHSVEPRTYAICTKFHLGEGGVAETAVEAETTPECDARYSKTVTAFQTPIYYWDSYDTSHVDSQYSGYRGQQQECLSKEIQDAITLQSYLGDGGLVPTISDDEIKDRKKVSDCADKLIKQQEKELKKDMKNAQKNSDECIDGDLYGIANNPNCDRQYKNTYIPGVQYDVVLQQVLETNDVYWEPYLPARKDDPFATPADPIGEYKVNGKPSTTPKEGKKNKAEPIPYTTGDGTSIMVGGDSGTPSVNGGTGYTGNTPYPTATTPAPVATTEQPVMTPTTEETATSGSDMDGVEEGIDGAVDEGDEGTAFIGSTAASSVSTSTAGALVSLTIVFLYIL